jgi:hypothetical protein
MAVEAMSAGLTGLIVGAVIGGAGGLWIGKEITLRRLGAAAVRGFRASLRRR